MNAIRIEDLALPGQVIAATQQHDRRRRRAALLRVVAVLAALGLGMAGAYGAVTLLEMWVIDSIGP